MPPELVATINKAINDSLADPAVIGLLAKSGATPLIGSAEAFAALNRNEAALVDEFIKTVGIKK
jgi:tripartite-type tricarboxylate transporter receptor subunit TctC